MAQGHEAALTKAMSATPIFMGVSAARVRDLGTEGRVRIFRRGTYLCHQGDEADDVFFLVSGRVEVSSVSPTGSRVLHATVDTPQFIGELGVLGELPAARICSRSTTRRSGRSRGHGSSTSSPASPPRLARCSPRLPGRSTNIRRSPTTSCSST